ncbi:hypothetical protein A2U01_0028288 [Trifolium medium]|uniref:Uncharacterized protein n=1 Tax=Trifolium medium TaxID=97028 RepID=A0A392P581_9FABA|nr:hypothetical protein [Trifolium medium]
MARSRITRSKTTATDLNLSSSTLHNVEIMPEPILTLVANENTNLKTITQPQGSAANAFTFIRSALEPPNPNQTQPPIPTLRQADIPRSIVTRKEP